MSGVTARSGPGCLCKRNPNDRPFWLESYVGGSYTVDRQKNPHDPAPCTVLPPMRGVDPGRDALPIASDAERALPDARGRVNGA